MSDSMGANLQLIRPLLAGIPSALKALRWGVWKAELRGCGKIAKAPRHPASGRNIAANDPSQWADYKECEAAVASGRFDGFGVLLDGTTGLVGIDIDDWEETAPPNSPTRGLLSRAKKEGIYIERSPSGKGLRAFCIAELDGGKGRRKGGIELYSKDRFLTVTGAGKGEIAPAQWLVDALLAGIGAGVTSAGGYSDLVTQPPRDGADADAYRRVLVRAAQEKPQLWEGDWQGGKGAFGALVGNYPSQSEADLALMGAIVRAAREEGVPEGELATVASSVFGQSALAQREKWQTNAYYQNRTVSLAIEHARGSIARDPACEITGDDSAQGDILNGRNFAKLWRGKFLYAPVAGVWLKWCGTHWGSCALGEEMQAAKAVAEAMLHKATQIHSGDPDRGKRLIVHATKAHNLNRLEAMLRLGSSEPDMSVLHADMDADPWLLGVTNGVLNLRTGALLDASPDQRISKQCGAAYDPHAECPRWEAFLLDIFDGDSATVETIQRALGYTLTGQTAEEKLFICHGFGANGKSVFANVVGAILADYGKTAPPSLLTVRRSDDAAPRNDVAMLAGARYVSINELQDGARLDEQVVKLLAGREKISARFLHREHFEFMPQFTPWLRTNHRPVVTGSDDGIWRRLVLIPFRKQFSEEKRDPHLETKLLAERDGILRWMVEGARGWARDGLKLSPMIKAGSLEYREESDLLGEFITEHCTVEPVSRVEQATLYAAWRFWCEQNGIRTMAKASLTRKLAERGFHESRSNGKRYYTGLAHTPQGGVVAQGR